MKTVSFYSYKGGVGRSLALAYCAKYLAEYDFKVCIVDMDLEAPGIIHKLVETPDHSKPGVLDYIYKCWDDLPPESIKEYIHDCKTASGHIVHLMSAGKGIDEDYWYKLAKLDWVELFAGERNEGLYIFEALKQQIKNDLNPDFLFFDSRAGVTIMSKVCCAIIPDATILLTANSSENFRGTKQIYWHIKSSTKFKPNETPTEIFFALTRIPQYNKEKEAIVQKKLKTEINDPDLKFENISIIHTDNDVGFDEHVILLKDSKNEQRRQIKKDYFELIFRLASLDQLKSKNALVFYNRVIERDPDFAQTYYNGNTFYVKQESEVTVADILERMALENRENHHLGTDLDEPVRIPLEKSDTGIVLPVVSPVNESNSVRTAKESALMVVQESIFILERSYISLLEERVILYTEMGEHKEAAKDSRKLEVLKKQFDII